jgi:hypothetical protein
MNATEIVAMVGGGSVVGTILIAVITSWIKRGDRGLDEASEIRKELRLQNATQQSRIDVLINRLDALESDLDSWKQKYYTLQQSYNTLMLEKDSLLKTTIVMQGEIDILTKKVSAMEAGKRQNTKS